MKKEKIYTNVIMPIFIIILYFIIDKYYPGIYEKLQNSSSVREQFLSVKLLVFGMHGVIFESVFKWCEHNVVFSGRWMHDVLVFIIRRGVTNIGKLGDC